MGVGWGGDKLDGMRLLQMSVINDKNLRSDLGNAAYVPNDTRLEGQ